MNEWKRQLLAFILWLFSFVWLLFWVQELRERVLRGKYRIPFYMSTDCENLLKKFLILNPLKRYTLEVCRSFVISHNCLCVTGILKFRNRFGFAYSVLLLVFFGEAVWSLQKGHYKFNRSVFILFCSISSTCFTCIIHELYPVQVHM